MNWAKWTRWTFLGLAFLLAVIVAGGLITINTPAFHRYLLGKIVQEASAATGGRVEIRNYDFKLLGLKANAYEVVIHGTETDSTRPLLSLDRITVKLKILSVLHREINLNELELEHPVIRLQVNREGKNNLPNPSGPRQSSSSINIFDLAVGRVAIDRGEIYYNDQPHSLDAELHDLRAQITFAALARRYDGSLAYHDGHFSYGALAPPPHTLNAQFSAVPGQLSLKPVVTLGGSRAEISAEVRDFDNPYVSGKYDILLHTQDFSTLSSAAAAGDVRLRGGLEYKTDAGRSGLKAVSLNGDLASGAMSVQSEGTKVDLNNLRGRYALSKGRFSAQDWAANLLGGEIIANLSVARVDQPDQINLHADLKSISIDQLKAVGKQNSLPLYGIVNGTINAASKAGVKALQAHADLNISSQLENRATASGAVVPVAGAIHADYSFASGRLALQNTQLHTPATTIQARGEISERSSLNLMVTASDLRELVSLVSTLRPESPIPVPVAGAATINAMVTGSTHAPQISAQVAASNLQVQKSRWSTARFQVKAIPSGFALQNGMLESAERGQLAFNFSTGLQHWSYSPEMPIAATVNIRDFPAEQLQALAGTHYPVHGDLTGSLDLKGSQQNPVGTANLKLANANLYGQTFQDLQVQSNGDGNNIHSTVNAATSAGSLIGNLDFAPKTQAYQVHVAAPQIVLAELVPVRQKDVPVSGTLNLIIDGKGTIADPQLTAKIQVQDLQYQRTTLTGVHADLAVANHRADLSIASGLANATVSAKASVNLSGDYYATGTFDTTSVPVAQLASIYVPSIPSELQGDAEVHATFKGPLRNYRQMEAHLLIPRLTAHYQNLQIENVGPLKADVADAVAVIQPGELKGTGTSVKFHGQVPLRDGSPMTLGAQGSVDVRLLRLLSPDLRTSGTVDLDMRGAGNFSHPSVEGTVRLQKVNVATVSAPLGLEQLEGVLTISNDRLQITQLNGQVGGGKISAGGFIALRPQVQMSVAVNAQSVRLRYPEGMRAILDSNLTFSGTTEAANLEGRVLIDSLSFTQDFDLADFMGQFSGSSVPSAGNSLADKVKMNVTIQSAEQLAATSSGLSIEGSANLRVIGTAGEPVIVGRADLTAGEIFFMKRRYQLERGVINFTDPNRTTPVVNMLITTVVKQYNISLTVIGPADKLRTSYVSDPPLPPVDVINLIARGQTTEEAAPSTLGANSVLAQGLASKFSGQVEKLAGLSSLQIDPLLGGDNTDPSARVAIQQRVTKNFLFTFSTDLTSAQNEVVQGEYQLNKRWSVSVTRDESGGFSVDGKFHTHF